MSVITLVAGQPVKAYNLSQHTYVRFRVVGGGTLFIGKTSGEVLSQTGTIIIASDNLVELHWTGELWASCDVSSPICQYSIDPDEAYAPPSQTESPGGAFRTHPPAWQDPKNQSFDYLVRDSPFCQKIRNFFGADDKNGLGRKLFHRE